MQPVAATRMDNPPISVSACICGRVRKGDGFARRIVRRRQDKRDYQKEQSRAVAFFIRGGSSYPPASGAASKSNAMHDN